MEKPRGIWTRAKKEAAKEAGLEGVKQLGGFLFPGVTLGTIMTVIASYVQWWWPFVYLSGIVVFVVVTLAVARYKSVTAEPSEQPLALVEPQHIIFIGLAGIIIFVVLTLGGFIWQIGAPSKAVAKTESSPTSVAEQKSPDLPAKQASPNQIINSARIEWDETGDVWLTGTYTRSGGELIGYVTYIHATSFETMGLTPNRVLSINPLLKEAPMEIDRVERFDRGTRAKVRIGKVVGQEGQQILQWGKETYRNRGVGVSAGSYLGTIILVDKDRISDVYKFAVIARRGDNSGSYPIPVFIGPETFGALEELAKNAGQ